MVQRPVGIIHLLSVATVVWMTCASVDVGIQTENETSMTKQNSLGNSWQFNIQATERFLHSNILWIPPLCITSLCNPSIFVLTEHFMKFHQRERYNSLEFPSFAHNLSRDFLKSLGMIS